MEDLIVSKMHRLAEKDRNYIAACHQARSLDLKLIAQRLAETKPAPEVETQALRFLSSLPRQRPMKKPSPSVAVPPYNRETHEAFLSADGKSVVVREWHPSWNLFCKVGNPLGPAIVSPAGSRYYLDGEALSEEEWQAHPDVLAARGTVSRRKAALSLCCLMPRLPHLYLCLRDRWELGKEAVLNSEFMGRCLDFASETGYMGERPSSDRRLLWCPRAAIHDSRCRRRPLPLGRMR